MRTAQQDIDYLVQTLENVVADAEDAGADVEYAYSVIEAYKIAKVEADTEEG